MPPRFQDEIPTRPDGLRLSSKPCKHCQKLRRDHDPPGAVPRLREGERVPACRGKVNGYQPADE
jgi:hypothetical protein